mgnify:CR=1 FL=1
MPKLSFIKGIFSFIQRYFKTVVFLTIVLFILTSNQEKSDWETPNLMQIEIKGAILDSSAYIELFEKASKDNIKGVLVNIDSPGGAVPPSIEIAYMIKELKKLKPVIVYASGTMASGSYYASIFADKIIANPGSMVGSIGVLFYSANLKELLTKIGIKPNILKAGKYKLVGNPTREPLPHETQMLQTLIGDIYHLFVTDVAQARKLDVAEHKTFADGKVFLAHKAKEVGLIDEVATILRAKEVLIQASNVVKPIWYKKDKLDIMLERFSAKLEAVMVSTLTKTYFY